jgi:hypothetical protein
VRPSGPADRLTPFPPLYPGGAEVKSTPATTLLLRALLLELLLLALFLLAFGYRISATTGTPLLPAARSHRRVEAAAATDLTMRPPEKPRL